MEKNPLELERNGATFDSRKLAALLRGGEDVLQKREEILRFVESKTEFRDVKPPVG